MELNLASADFSVGQTTCAAIAAETGAKVHPIVADHASDEGRAVILAACPDPDIFVATCAPPPFTGDFRDVSREEFERSVATALLSPIDYIKAVSVPMVEPQIPPGQPLI